LQFTTIMSMQAVQHDTVYVSSECLSLDATFNILPVTSHVTADDIVFRCRLMSMSVLLDFLFFSWGGFVVLGCLFYSVWFALFCNN
jgi:hypothetical protein